MDSLKPPPRLNLERRLAEERKLWKQDLLFSCKLQNLPQSQT